jgi:hypothetical protein
MNRGRAPGETAADPPKWGPAQKIDRPHHHLPEHPIKHHVANPGRVPKYAWASANTNPIAPARRLSSASRSAHRAALRVTEHRHRR